MSAAKERKSDTGTARGPARKRVPLWRRRRIAIGLGTALVLAIVAGGGWVAWDRGWIGRSVAEAEATLLAGTADLGFRVEEIYVVGRRRTPRDHLLDAVGLERGAPIFGLDIHAARDKLMTLPWVRGATVERLLPDTIVLRVDERRPVALWQRQGRFALIDDEGTIIRRQELARFSDLVVIIGDDAPAHAAALIDVLATQPDLRPLVRAATRVGGRRWNLRLSSGIDVRLPEEDEAAAWARLADYQRTHSVLERDVQVLDLRFPDRLIVRKAPRSEGTRDSSGRDT